MVRTISLTNFKCFSHLRLELAPLTLLCGVNGMGKSSVLQALLVLRQSFLTGELGQGRLVLGGDLADLGTGRDVLFDGADHQVIKFELHGDNVAAPCVLAFDYESGADRLRAQGSGAAALSGWEGLPPFSHLHYVTAERIGPRKLYGRSETAAHRSDLGPRGEHAMNQLAARWEDLMPEGDPRTTGAPSRQHGEVVDHWLSDVAPGTHLRIKVVPNADALIGGFSFDRVGDVRSNEYRATNVGFGLSYVLPVVAALLAPAGALCLIENPEAHLHPRGQTRMAELAVRAAAAGVQVIVETHSDHFLDGVRIAVRDGVVGPTDTRFHYFEQEDGQTVVSTPQIDSNGRLSRWPDGFFDQHELNLARLLAPKTSGA